MNHEEAKLILQAYRPGGEDAADPQFQEALAFARLDPALAEWLAGEAALDARIGAKLRESFAPPPGLQARLLAERRIVRPVAWWRRPAWHLVAACLAALLVVGAFALHSQRRNGFTAYRAEMADFVGNRLDRLDLMTHDIAEVRRWLTAHDANGDLALPAGLKSCSSIGCRVLDWRQRTVSLVCFDLGNRLEAHLLVIDRTLLKNPPTESPVFGRVGEVATVGWSRDGKTYLVASRGASQLDLMKLF